jgi:NADH dehydrogenase/NADH:ubiquinone oxidoreductase subunit G
MSNDPSPLRYMRTQSQEAANMAAAIAREAARTTEQAAAQTAEKFADEVDEARSSVADAGSKISGAANWAVDKATAAARRRRITFAGGQLRRSRAIQEMIPSERFSSPLEPVRC